MTTEIATQNILLKSSDGNWYSIPQGMKPKFVQLDEAVQELLLGTEEWLCAIDTFNNEFDQYLKD